MTQELRYCNRCGANLKPLSDSSSVPPTKLIGAVWAISVAIALVTLGGFGMIFALVMSLISRGMNLSAGGIGLVFFSSLIILVIDWLLSRQLSRVLDMHRFADSVQPAKKPDEKSIPQIGFPGDPISSVTDHTTRTFEPVSRKRTTQ